LRGRRSGAQPARGAQRAALVDCVAALPAALLVARDGALAWANAAAWTILAPHLADADAAAPALPAPFARALREVAAGAEPHPVVVTLASGERLWLRGRSSRAGIVAVTLQRERPDEPALRRAFAADLGLTAAEARLALRVYQGLTPETVALRLSLRPLVLRARLSRLYRRVGVPGRQQLLLVLDQVAHLHARFVLPEVAGDDRFVAASARAAARPLPRALRGDLETLLETARFAIGVVDPQGRLVAGNAAVRAVAGAATEGTRLPAPLRDEMVRRCADRAAPRITLFEVELPSGRAVGGAIPIAPQRVAFYLELVARQHEEVAQRLAARLGLDQRRARLAALVAEGHEDPSLAVQLATTPRTVQAGVAELRATLDAPDRFALVRRLREIAAEGSATPLRAIGTTSARPVTAGGPVAAAAEQPIPAEPSFLGDAIRGREVSNRLTLALLTLCRQQGLPVKPLVQGLEFASLRPDDADGWHSWSSLATFYQRLGRAVGGQPGLERFMTLGMQQFRPLRILGHVVSDPVTVFRYVIDHLTFATYVHLGGSVTRDGDEVRMVVGVPSDYEVPPEFWHASLAFYRALPRSLGLPDPALSMEHDAHQAEFRLLAPAPRRAAAAGRIVDDALLRIVNAAERLYGAGRARHPVYDAESAFTGTGYVLIARLVGTRLARLRSPAELLAALGHVWRHYFRSRDVAIENGDGAARRPGLRPVALAAGDRAAGHIVVEERVAATPLFAALLPWIGVAVEACGAHAVQAAPGAALDAAARAWGLTQRQREVLASLVAGRSNREIATALGCGERAVEVHLAAIRRRAGAPTRTALIAQALQGTAASDT
jgi:DNA-binding CsgD family transcriptional regulator